VSFFLYAAALFTIGLGGTHRAVFLHAMIARRT
jgi:hypothetical protein